MTRIEQLNAAIAAAQLELRNIQETCSHPQQFLSKQVRYGVRRPFDASTASPREYTDVFCTVCEKRWTVPGNH